MKRLVRPVVALVIGGLVALGAFAVREAPAQAKRPYEGTTIRAIAVNPDAAPLVGIDVSRTARFAFALGTMLAASGGVMISMYQTFNASMGVVFTMKALVIVIMGGLGNLMGALVAGLLLGVVETLVATYVDPGLTLAINFGLFTLILLLRPTGLFTRA